jgi:hypothetical protein
LHLVNGVRIATLALATFRTDSKPRTDMTSKKPTPPSQVQEETARREFLKQVGKGVAVTGPAIALLLAASSKPASAQALYVPECRIEDGCFN